MKTICSLKLIELSICIYCKIFFKDWTHQYDPYKVHRVLSPTCPFVLYRRNDFTTSSSSIVKNVPKNRRIRPSSHFMSVSESRIKSFQEHLHLFTAHSPEHLSALGFYFNIQNSMIECFSCHTRLFNSNLPNDLITVHNNQCTYAEQLRSKRFIEDYK